MAAIRPTDAPSSPGRRRSRTTSGTRLVSDVVQTTQFSGTHAARLLLLLPWVLSAAMPALQRLYILHPPTFSSPVSLFDSGTGGELHPLSALIGVVTLIWSQILEARRRQSVPEAEEEGSTSRWASALGECTGAKDVRSIKAWSRFDCFEAAVVCASAALGVLLTKFDLMLEWRVFLAIALLPLYVMVIVILKRMVHAVAYAQGRRFNSWVTGSATPALFKALLFEVVVLLMWFHASMYAPYPKPQLELALSVMLGTGNNSAILCDDEPAFQASFSLPFEYSPTNEPLDCDEPYCGYATWRDLCEARRLAPLAEQTKRTVWFLFFTVPVGLLLVISLVGNGRIAMGSNGELELKGLLAPHILFALGLGFCTLSIGVYYTVTLLIHAPQLMSGRAPSDPRVCLASSACGEAYGAFWLNLVIFVLLPFDTLGRFLKQRSNRKRSYFLSYKQKDENDGAVQMLYHLLPKGSAWLDKYAADRSEEGMVAGVTKKDVFIAIISPNYFSSYFCCLEMHTALSQGKRVLVVWNQSKFMVQHALGWLPPELRMLTTNEFLPIQEDIQMAKTCVARIEAADVKPLSGQAFPSSFGTDPNSGESFFFGSQARKVEAIKPPEAINPEEDVLAKVKQMLNGDAEKWCAVPPASTSFKRPSEWPAAAPLAEMLKDVQDKKARLAEVFREVQPLTQQMFAKAVPLIATSDEAQRSLLHTFSERKRGSLEQYLKILRRTRRDPTFDEFLDASQELQVKLKARVGECVQKKPSGGGALDFVMLRSQAGGLQRKFDKFVEDLAEKCGAKAIRAPLKGAWRAIEKMALRVESGGGKCGALTEGPLDATPLCDVLRGSLQCKDFTSLVTALELLGALDSEFGDLAQALKLTQRIRLLRIKDRFAAPTSGGWADVLVNFVFEDDATKHVVELQLQHENLLLVRKQGGGHQDYNEFRSAFELLEAVGKAPTDAFDAETNLSVERRLKELEERLGKFEDYGQVHRHYSRSEKR